jgi:acetyltransferase-like isoleucine patch superfamily enzyme
MKKDKKNFFENNIYISDSSQIQIGAHCHINENVFIQGATIGDYVMIAPGVSILNSTHGFSRLDIPMVLQGRIEHLNPILEDDVWVGRNAIILPGVIIKKGSVVGAGAVVTKNIEEYSIVGGVPAKLIKMRV